MAKPPRKPHKPRRTPPGDKPGYCNPPKETRFPHQVIRRKRGPKPHKSLDDYIEEILDSTRMLPGPGGRMRRVTVREFLANSAVKRALEGDRHMYAEIARRDAARRGATSDEQPADDALGDDDAAIIAAFLRGRGKKRDQGKDGGDGDKDNGADAGGADEGGADEGRDEDDEGGDRDEEGS